jgi:hypothetical protein
MLCSPRLFSVSQLRLLRLLLRLRLCVRPPACGIVVIELPVREYIL